MAFDPTSRLLASAQRALHRQVVGCRVRRTARHVQPADERPIRRRLQPGRKPCHPPEVSTAGFASGKSARRPRRNQRINRISLCARRTDRAARVLAATAAGSVLVGEITPSRFGTQPVSRRSRNWRISRTGRRPWRSRRTAGRSPPAAWTAACRSVRSADGRSAAATDYGDACLITQNRLSLNTPSSKIATRSEVEPNDSPAHPMDLMLPARVDGLLALGKDGHADVDYYRFHAKAGQTWLLETEAARKKSPADTRIDVLHTDGSPVLRCLLRAVRDSSVTFRPIDSRQGGLRVENWQEMDLDEFLYMSGEVCRLFRAPRGPDSEYGMYTENRARRCYFDTSAVSHTLNEPIYIVEPYAPGTRLSDNGLPIFPIYYSNDDDASRKFGHDSRLMFTAPADGTYLARVADVRGYGGPEFKYTFTIREPQPDFNVSLQPGQLSVPAGGGQRFGVALDRVDDFEGPVRVEMSGIPTGSCDHFAPGCGERPQRRRRNAARGDRREAAPTGGLESTADHRHWIDWRSSSCQNSERFSRSESGSGSQSGRHSSCILTLARTRRPAIPPSPRRANPDQEVVIQLRRIGDGDARNRAATDMRGELRFGGREPSAWRYCGQHRSERDHGAGRRNATAGISTGRQMGLSERASDPRRRRSRGGSNILAASAARGGESTMNAAQPTLSAAGGLSRYLSWTRGVEVGFRYTVASAARTCRVNGYVRNCLDGIYRIAWRRNCLDSVGRDSARTA